MARTTLLTPELEKRIRDYVNAGTPIPLACQACGVKWDTAKVWMRRGREGEEPFAHFVEELDQAKAMYAVAMQLNITRAANKGDAAMALKMLEQRYPKHYRRPEHKRGDEPEVAPERTVLLYPVAMAPGPRPKTLELSEGHPFDLVELDDDGG